jgi:hypothetical protein
MEFIKHFITNDGGRFAVAVDGDMVVVEHLSGTAPRPGHLYLVIESWPQLQEAANAAAATRRNMYAVERKHGMSGAVDYRLRECRTPETANFPIRASVHVSMYGKLNQGLRVWLGDLAPLCWAIFMDHPWEKGQTVDEASIFISKDWSAIPLHFSMGEDGLAVGMPPSQEDEENEDNDFVAWALLATLDKEDAE